MILNINTSQNQPIVKLHEISSKKINGIKKPLHLEKKIAGVIKVEDGNQRAIPSAITTIFKKLKITSFEENIKLSSFLKSNIFNHSRKKTGCIFTKIELLMIVRNFLKLV